MKKLFMWSALLMTGFAFYSCDDVVDNPVKDTNAEWNYSVSVTCPDFTGLFDDNGPVAYQVPKTLYVLNEQGQELGTISTPTAPAVNTAATYSGTLKGALGNQKLIITTKIGADLSKQDGTIKSAAENGIVQADTVAIKIYNANSQKVTTAAAKLKNSISIAHVRSNVTKAEDKIAITSDKQAFEWTVSKEYDPTKSNHLYIAIPANGDPEAKYSITTNNVDGFTREATLTGDKLTLGQVTPNLGYLSFVKNGVDLTIWDAEWRKTHTGWNELYQGISNDKSFIITQSGKETLDSVSVYIYGNKDAKVALTVNNIRLGDTRCFYIYNGAKFDLSLIGDNKFGKLYLYSPFTKIGTGTWAFEELHVGGNTTTTTDTEQEIDKVTVNYFAEYTIEDNLTLKYLEARNGGKINIADGKKVKVINKGSYPVSINSEGTINVGKGSELYAEVTGVDQGTIIGISGGQLNIGEKAKVTANGYKGNTGMTINASNTWGNKNPNSSIKIGESASLELKGGIENSTGQGLSIENYLGGKVSIELEKNATLSAYGISRNAIYANSGDWRGTTSEKARPTTIIFNIAEGAKVIANESEEPESFGFYYYGNTGSSSCPDAILNITGKGAFEAKSATGAGMVLNGKVNITGANVTAIGGAGKSAIKTFATTAIALTYSKDSATKLTAKAGTGSTICIADADDKELAKFAEASYTDTTADGVRTITPKAPAAAE